MDRPEDGIIENAAVRTRIRCLMQGVLRVTHVPTSETRFPPDRPWMKDVFLHLNDISEEMDGRAGSLTARQTDGRLQILDGSGNPVLCEAHPCRLDPYKKSRLSWVTEKDERFYGGGEWFNGFGRQEGSLRLRNLESFSVVQGSRTYSNIPFFLSSRGYGIFLLNSHTSFWRFDAKKNRLVVEAEGLFVDYMVFHGKDFKEIIRIYTALTGRPPLLPMWAFGLWATCYPQGHQDEVVEHARLHRRRGIPLDAVILDYHWEERFHNFRWRESLIPRPQQLVDTLHQLNLHLGLITTPFVNRQNQPLKKIGLQLMARDIPPGMVLGDDRALAEYEEAKGAGYLAHDNAEWWFGRGGMVDFTDPAACDWWNGMAGRLYEQGVDFFKNDDGEYLPDDAHSALGMGGREYHNLYGFYYGRAMYDGLQEFCPDERSLVYARSVWAGSQRFPALFLGDQKPTFECILRTMRAGLNLSLLGFSYWTADVFGLDGKTTPETHMRYAQWALFAPVARYFWRPPQVDDTRFPWSHSAEVEENFRRLAHLRYHLLPVYYRLAWEAYRDGLPILRPMILEYPQDERFADCVDQFMLGEDLLMAPVVERGSTRRKVELPAGRWYDFWSERKWEGPVTVEVEAPLDHLPLFLRGGSIVPLGPAIDSIPGEHRFDRLSLHVFPPFPAEGWLYEDDGVSLSYRQGAFRLTRFSTLESGKNLLLKMDMLEDGFVEGQFERETEIILHDIPPPQKVIIKTGAVEILPCEEYPSTVRFKIIQPAGSTTQIEIIS